MRWLIFFLVLLSPASASAEDRVFASYDEYAGFVDEKIMWRDFVALINSLGGEDEYTEAQLNATNAQLLNAMPFDFTGSAVLKRVELTPDFSQEMRVYWNRQKSYVYFYAFLHRREEGLVVLKFNLNTNSDNIFDKF
ncbi:hypothetical protein [Ruegeria marina]|uniref:DUF3887 domain-containing protein n=1 Tax=Ruegeria marina TaxID=639004 RepID=A0A1G6IJ76_9RHOB|nr:hypothetical protein [Ruegeria marina]SDC06514.1 hypothetical protein SAMN04488239_101138 [Ruegeria marina]